MLRQKALANLLCQRFRPASIATRVFAIRRLTTPSTVSWLSERLSKQLSRIGALDVIRSAAEKVVKIGTVVPLKDDNGS